MTVLAVVYNEIDYDGRVQRAAQALGAQRRVVVVCLDSGAAFRSASFDTIRVRRWRGRLEKLTHLTLALCLCWHAIRLRPDIVHAHDFFTAFPGWLAAKVSGAKLVYDAHELIIPEPGRLMSARDRFWYRLERAVIVRARLVIAANDERAALMAQHYGLATLPLVVRNIPPAPQSRPISVQQIGMPDRLTVDDRERLVVYQGDMSLDRGLGKWVQAIAQLPSSVRLVLIGGGPDLGAIQGIVQAHGLSERVVALGRVARDRLVELLAQCHVGVVTYPFDGLNNRYCASNKIFEYAQAGLCVVATEQPPLVNVIERYGIGELVRREDGPHELAAAIGKVIAGEERYRKGLARFLSESTWDAEAEKLRTAVESLDERC